MLTDIALYQILRRPLVMWIGILTIVLMLITALIPILRKKNMQIPYELHVWMARFTILIAVFHGVLALSLFL
jgi:hypothetical protein